MGLAMSNYLEEQILTHIFRTGSFTKPTDLAIGLLKTLPSDDAGTGLAELTMTGYSRVARDPLDANWSDPSAGTQGETDNSAEVDFGTLTGTGERAIGVGIWDADAGGNLLFYGPLAINWFRAAIDAGTNQFQAPGHGLTDDTRVFLRDIVTTTGADEQTEYWIITSATDTFQISTSQGGAAVALTGDGSALVGTSKAKDIGDGDAIKFNAGTLDISLD